MLMNVKGGTIATRMPNVSIMLAPSPVSAVICSMVMASTAQVGCMLFLRIFCMLFVTEHQHKTQDNLY